MRMFNRIERIIGRWLLVGVLMLVSVAILVAQEKLAKPVDPASNTPKDATPAPVAKYVGSAACKACHKKLCEPWPESVHGKALTQDSLPAEIKGCEACHGPASIHISSAGKTKPSIPKADEPKTANAVCGACHFQSESSKAPKEWQNIAGRAFARSTHGRKNLACVSCHVGHANGNDKQLAKPSPDLCLGCHAALLESSPGKKAPYTHAPVVKGLCLKCHDPHGSSNSNLVLQNVEKVCVECHDVKDAKLLTAHKGYPVADAKCADCHDPHSHDQKTHLVKVNQHSPFIKGKCETCHTKPTPEQPIGLVKPVKELCLMCHPASKMTPETENAHPPVKQGMCTACHNPHVSSEKALMKAKLAYVCFTCHSKVSDATVAENRHKVLDAALNCMLCHKPHSSVEQKLLKKKETALCGQCHKHGFSHPIEKDKDGKPVLDPTNGKVMICSSCHDVHGGKFEMLTKADKSRELCVMCHDKVVH